MSASRILVIAQDFGLEEDGTYRPGGLALYSRLVARALASSPNVNAITALSLGDSPAAAQKFQQGLVANQPARISVRGFSGSKARIAVDYLRQHRRYDLAMFLHLGVGQLAVLTPFRRVSLWLVGIEAWRPLQIHERMLVRAATPLLSISRFSSDELLRFNPGLPPARPIHLCVEPDESAAEAPPPVYDAATREPAILIVARLAAAERYKGHDQLIDAWPEILHARQDARLWVAGTGDDLERLKLRVARLPEPARGSIEFLGRLSGEALADRYARARAFTMPSLREGFGLVFVEAMRAGLPCIASHDAAAEVVVDGSTGFLVPQEPRAIASACGRLLTDDGLANRFSRAGRERYEQQFKFHAFRSRLLGALDLS